MNLASTTSALTSLSMAMPICSHCAREVTKIKRCSVCKIIYCSVKCQKKSWKTGGHRSTCKSPAMIANICYLMDKSSSRWIETLTMDEIFRLQMVSKTCTVMVNHGWVPYDVLIPRSYRKYSIKKINKQGEAWYSTIYIKRDTITNETLRNLWQSAGNQMRTLTLKNLPTISATGLAMLCEQPLLRELDLTNCTGINGTELMATFFVGTFSFPMLKDIKLSGVVGLTKEHLDVLHTRFGIISCDVFECQNCSQVSNEQAQCRFKHCQPSVLALCIDCADTMKCINIYCKGFGCGDCTGDYEDWTSCDACGVMSCEDCYEVRWCDGCEYSFCENCKVVDYCSLCSESHCEDCKHVGYCYECNNCYCESCRYVGYCSKCSEGFCEDCKPMGYCEKCGGCYCEDCKHVGYCSKCSGMFCQDCKWTMWCEGCNESFCADCNFVTNCERCGHFHCENCSCSR